MHFRINTCTSLSWNLDLQEWGLMYYDGGSSNRQPRLLKVNGALKLRCSNFAAKTLNGMLLLLNLFRTQVLLLCSGSCRRFFQRDKSQIDVMCLMHMSPFHTWNVPLPRYLLVISIILNFREEVPYPYFGAQDFVNSGCSQREY